MATLRELRIKATDLGLSFEKSTSKEELEEMIAEAEVDSVPTAKPEEGLKIVKKRPPPEEPLSFADDLMINDSDIQSEFVRQPALFWRYAQVEAKAAARFLEAKIKMEAVEAQIYSQVRRNFEESGTKFTEKKLECEVILSPEFVSAQAHYLKTKEEADLCRAAKESFLQRSQMLIQLGSTKRQEAEACSMSLRDRAREVMASS